MYGCGLVLMYSCLTVSVVIVMQKSDSHMGDAVNSVGTVHVQKGTLRQLPLADGFCWLSQDAILGR